MLAALSQGIRAVTSARRRSWMTNADKIFLMLYSVKRHDRVTDATCSLKVSLSLITISRFVSDFVRQQDANTEQNDWLGLKATLPATAHTQDNFPLCWRIVFHSILFHSILFYSILSLTEQLSWWRCWVLTMPEIKKTIHVYLLQWFWSFLNKLPTVRPTMLQKCNTKSVEHS